MKIILSDSSEIEIEPSISGGDFGAQSVDWEKRRIQFQDAIQSGSTILKDSISALRSNLKNNLPESLEIEIGLKFGAEGNLILAKGTAEASITIKATWKK